MKASLCTLFQNKAIQSAVQDCQRFYLDNQQFILDESSPLSQEGLAYYSENEKKAALAGYNFWRTRNHHGVGFWDGKYPRYRAELDKSSLGFDKSNIYLSRNDFLDFN